MDMKVVLMILAVIMIVALNHIFYAIGYSCGVKDLSKKIDEFLDEKQRENEERND